MVSCELLIIKGTSDSQRRPGICYPQRCSIPVLYVVCTRIIPVPVSVLLDMQSRKNTFRCTLSTVLNFIGFGPSVRRSISCLHFSICRQLTHGYSSNDPSDCSETRLFCLTGRSGSMRKVNAVQTPAESTGGCRHGSGGNALSGSHDRNRDHY